MTLIALALIWTVWCALHSLLIANVARQAAKKVLGYNIPVFRLLYVGFSIASLILVLWYQFSVPARLLFEKNLFWAAGQFVLLIYGIFMFYAGARVYDMGYFLGFRQWKDHRTHKKPLSFPFHTEGILAHVRHPWYSGGIAFVWGIGSCTDVYIVSRSILTVYFIIGTLLEEKRLKIDLGTPYAQYCRRVPMLIPWKSSPKSLIGYIWK